MPTVQREEKTISVSHPYSFKTIRIYQWWRLGGDSTENSKRISLTVFNFLYQLIMKVPFLMTKNEARQDFFFLSWMLLVSICYRKLKTVREKILTKSTEVIQKQVNLCGYDCAVEGTNRKKKIQRSTEILQKKNKQKKPWGNLRMKLSDWVLGRALTSAPFNYFSCCLILPLFKHCSSQKMERNKAESHNCFNHPFILLPVTACKPSKCTQETLAPITAVNWRIYHKNWEL